MQAINSQSYDGRPSCINCGYCSGFGCPIHDRASALVPLRHALLTGNAEVRDEAMVIRIEHDGARATGVRWVDADGDEHTESADFVVLGAGAVESPRLVLLSDVDDSDGWIGAATMFHWFTDGFGIWLSERIHANRGQDTSQAIDDFCDPDFPGAREAAASAWLPYFRGGIVEMGGTTHQLEEALQYVELMEIFDAEKPFGRRFKELMRLSALRDRLAGAVMIAEDLPQRSNRVELDPAVRDRYGLPVAAVTYAPHTHEFAAQEFYTPHLVGLIEAAGADVAGAPAQTGTPDHPAPTGSIVPGGAHLHGGLRMSDDPAEGATDGFGRLRALPNVGVADASVFPTSGAHNPTLTIFTTALRNARAWAGLEGEPTLPATFSEGQSASGDGGDGAGAAIAAGVGAAAFGGAAAVSWHRARRRGWVSPDEPT